MLSRMFDGMKRMKYFLLFIFVLSAGQASAQTVDVRAISRQRGFKAYQTPVRQAAPEQAVLSRQESAFRQKNSEQNMPEESEHPVIRQTGIRIFQKEDEGKVLNFDVENPEFKKLNKRQQQDLVNRITFE